MGISEHYDILSQGIQAWNHWREAHPEITPDLSGLDLHGWDLQRVNFCDSNLAGVVLHEAIFTKANLQSANLYRADLSDAGAQDVNFDGANLSQANLAWTYLKNARLTNVDLSGADLINAHLPGAQLDNAVLSNARLTRANLYAARLNGADLTGADLSGASLVETSLDGVTLVNCRVYGISAWDLQGEPESMSHLIVTPADQDAIAVDHLEVAQFVFLLLNNQKIREVIDTIGEKGVLILGRFTKERKHVLDALRVRLREFGFVPMMFDFERPSQRDFTETIKTLAGLSRFIIADITNPKSSPLELQATMPEYMIPFVPIIQEDEEPFAMFRDLKQKYGEWVLDILEYDSVDNLLKVLDDAVVKPALEKADQLLIKKAEVIRKRHVKDYT